MQNFLVFAKVQTVCAGVGCISKLKFLKIVYIITLDMVYLVSTTLLQVSTSEKLTFFQLALGNSKKVALVNKIMYLKERTLI